MMIPRTITTRPLQAALLLVLCFLVAAADRVEGVELDGFRNQTTTSVTATTITNTTLASRPTFPPTKDPFIDAVSPRRDQVIAYLAGRFGDVAVLSDHTTPQGQAAQWMATQDNPPIPVSSQYVDAFSFVQRYSLAVLYYSWGGWNTTVVPFLDERDECSWRTNRQVEGFGYAVAGVRCNELDEISSIELRKYLFHRCSTCCGISRLRLTSMCCILS